MSNNASTKLTWMNNLPTLGMITNVGSAIAPYVAADRLPYPYRMTLVTTRQCNSKCQMCNIWQQKDLPQLELADLTRIFSQNDFSFLRSITITGGEATMRADLPQLFEIVAENCKNLEHVMLATSGLNTKRTIRFVEEMLMTSRVKLPKLTSFQVQISIDGIGELHDQIRGIPGYFEIVKNTIQGLRELQFAYPILNLRTMTVVLPQNLEHIQEIRQYIEEMGLPTCFTPVVISNGYYENKEDSAGLVATKSDTTSPITLFETLAEHERTPMRFHYQTMAQMFEGEQRNRPCMMGFYDFVLEYNGDVFACVNCENYCFGNLFEKSFEELWFGEEAIHARQQVRTNCCPTCASPCHYPVVSLQELITEKVVRLRKKVGM
jgi:MoaA/NifB/PqqE/SkfB family radical SAM enzyme